MSDAEGGRMVRIVQSVRRLPSGHEEITLVPETESDLGLEFVLRYRPRVGNDVESPEFRRAGNEMEALIDALPDMIWMAVSKLSALYAEAELESVDAFDFSTIKPEDITGGEGL